MTAACFVVVADAWEIKIIILKMFAQKVPTYVRKVKT